MMMLSDVLEPLDGGRRLLNRLPLHAPLRCLHRVAQVAAELAWTGVVDRVAPLHGQILDVAPGAQMPRYGSLALYVHWSPTGRISAMVRRQVALWHANGFDVFFITNAKPPKADWDAIAESSVLRIMRNNAGRDFGAWRDAAAIAMRNMPWPTEILLANDSVLGPFRPLEPLVAAWRKGGEGLFGLTESLGGGAHLQSYALLARGAGAIGTMLDHLAELSYYRSKWRLVQQGEIGLTRRMRVDGHRCAALFGYRALCESAAVRPDRALNPTHHLWRELIERQGFPYLKTELVLRNPGHLPGVERWDELVPAAEALLIREHLTVMSARR
jgi:lipopolysaccharide biosynthesis protein